MPSATMSDVTPMPKKAITRCIAAGYCFLWRWIVPAAQLCSGYVPATPLRNHNPRVGGSSPSTATSETTVTTQVVTVVFWWHHLNSARCHQACHLRRTSHCRFSRPVPCRRNRRMHIAFRHSQVSGCTSGCTRLSNNGRFLIVRRKS